MGTMEVKERAVAAMHSLAMQDKGKGRDPGSAVNLLASTPSGLQALVSLIESGNTSTQGHAAATLGMCEDLVVSALASTGQGQWGYAPPMHATP